MHLSHLCPPRVTGYGHGEGMLSSEPHGIISYHGCATKEELVVYNLFNYGLISIGTSHKIDRRSGFSRLLFTVRLLTLPVTCGLKELLSRHKSLDLRLERRISNFLGKSCDKKVVPATNATVYRLEELSLGLTRPHAQTDESVTKLYCPPPRSDHNSSGKFTPRRNQ